jgi:SAM-dependent methyltransferase
MPSMFAIEGPACQVSRSAAENQRSASSLRYTCPVMPAHRVRVSPLPEWLDWRRLLGPGAWQESRTAAGLRVCHAELERTEAADLAARLRGVGIGGAPLLVEVQPPLPRNIVRRARTDEARRYRDGSPGFTRADARVDPEAKRSLTPEALALELGRNASKAHVLDACCGAGGNAIGFARAGCRVTAIEIDRERLELARHNARLYGVSERIRFLPGDACALVPEVTADLLFIDAPWGERYNKGRVEPADLPLLGALLSHRNRFARTWLKVPPSFDPETVPGARVQAWFGVAHGDARRVKFLLLECERESAATGAAGSPVT